MYTQKIFIKNRKGQNVRVCIDSPEASGGSAPAQDGLAFIMPGLGSHHDKPKFRGIADILARHGYAAVSFDPTNSFGESDGDYQDATFTNYYEDLQDVIEWASAGGLEGLAHADGHAEEDARDFPAVKYVEPFVLVGHSLGGMGVTLYAETYPERVKAVAPLSATISGKLSFEARPAQELEEWRRLGYQEAKGPGGVMHKLKWSHMEDRLRYDNLVHAKKITMPVLMVVGENDSPTPPKHQQLLLDAIGTAGSMKEFHVIAGADHELKTPEAHAELMKYFENWLTEKVTDK